MEKDASLYSVPVNMSRGQCRSVMAMAIMSVGKIALASLGLAIACLGFASCANPASSGTSTASQTAQKTGNSTLVITMKSPSSRAIVAGSGDYTTAFNAIGSYKVVVSSANASSIYTSTTVTSGTCTIAGIVAANDYLVSVYAYNDASTQNSTTQIAQGGTTLAVGITAGATTSVTVPLSFTQNAEAGASNAGGFSLPIHWPVSTKLAYIHATLDGTALADPTVTTVPTDPTTYTATLSASGLAGKSHTLDIYFKTSNTATTVIGPFIESINIWDGVTDRTWADSNGTPQPALTLSASEFADSSASLTGITVSTTTLEGGFSPTTLNYTYTTGPSGAFYVTVRAASSVQSLSYSFNDISGTWASVSDNTFTTPSLTGIYAKPNTVKITVTAADRKTSVTYVVTDAQLLTQATLISTLSGVTSGSALSANYVLTDDMTLTASTFTPIAESTYASPTNPFNGTFDGNGHTITLSLTSDGGIQGLFRNIGSSGVVKNLNIVATISPGANDWIGAVAAINYGTISNCSVSGTVTGRQIVGGLVGCNESTGVISDCYSTATCSYNGGKHYGGLAGENHGFIKLCYARGAVVVAGGDTAGGLVGLNYSDGSISNCYSTGAVSASSLVGGLVGSNVGGTLTACFYDTTTSGMSDSNGTPTITANMKNQATFSGWDFSTIWGIDSGGTINNGYPYLQYFGSSTVTP